MSQLTDKRCQVCEGGVPPLDAATVQKMLAQVPGWELAHDGRAIKRNYSFKGFYPTMSFVNAIAFVVQREGHHPDLEVGYNYCRVTFSTHAIDGLTENDFICAAKINALNE